MDHFHIRRIKGQEGNFSVSSQSLLISSPLLVSLFATFSLQVRCIRARYCKSSNQLPGFLQNNKSVI
ncbi:hypothetical protein L2E82_48074 [Cichorium intybus]|uniref:Uncharacterized protein n=1 Tax=Cichorium intybus TaxID=13427 RepID=A0ACB8YYQ7_CICIN|nr:hypothetical protein L2E82_48074 [Cichorium intybus]